MKESPVRYSCRNCKRTLDTPIRFNGKNYQLKPPHGATTDDIAQPEAIVSFFRGVCPYCNHPLNNKPITEEIRITPNKEIIVRPVSPDTTDLRRGNPEHYKARLDPKEIQDIEKDILYNSMKRYDNKGREIVAK